MKRLIPGLALAAVASAGCTLGPDYHPPQTPDTAAGTFVSADPAVESATQARDDWWRLYQDPMLDQLVAQAFAANDDLRAARANLSAAGAMVQAARAGLYPGTEIAAAGVRGRDPTTDEILEIVGHPPQTIWLFDDVFQASYELDLFGRVRRTIETAKDNVEATAAMVDALKITVAAETARAYAGVCAYGEQLEVAHRSLDVVNNQLRIAEGRRDAGNATEFDVIRQRGLVDQVRAGIPMLEGQRRAALLELAALLGKTPAEAPTQTLACQVPPHLAALLPVGDGAALLKRRPDVRAADRQLAAATAGIGVAMADLYPRVSLTGFYGGAASHLFELRNETGLIWGIGPSISWNFPNQALPRARVRRARAAAEQALAQFDSVVLQALKEVEKALTFYGAELDHRDALLAAQQEAHKALELAHGQFDAGAISSLDLLTSEQVQISADAAVAASDAALIQYQLAIFKALGGGWQGATAASP
jgi:NodT family efflux transporter outer membrane factor (OMF) lipoprotein